jgi:hypothetical protein
MNGAERSRNMMNSELMKSLYGVYVCLSPQNTPYPTNLGLIQRAIGRKQKTIKTIPLTGPQCYSVLLSTFLGYSNWWNQSYRRDHNSSRLLRRLWYIPNTLLFLLDLGFGISGAEELFHLEIIRSPRSLCSILIVRCF